MIVMRSGDRAASAPPHVQVFAACQRTPPYGREKHPFPKASAKVGTFMLTAKFPCDFFSEKLQKGEKGQETGSEERETGRNGRNGGDRGDRKNRGNRRE